MRQLRCLLHGPRNFLVRLHFPRLLSLERLPPSEEEEEEEKEAQRNPDVVVY